MYFKEQFIKHTNELIKISLPLIGSMISGLIMMLIDRICLARYSLETLIASGPAIYTAMAIMGLLQATVGLTRTFVSQSYGKGNDNGVKRSARTGIITALILGFIFVAMQPLVAMIPELSDRPESIKILEREFLAIVPFYGFFSVLNMAFASIFIGVLRTKTAMIVGMIGHALDGFFSVGLVFGCFGLPELGMAGSSGGTLVSAFICSLIYLYIILKADLLPAFIISEWKSNLFVDIKKLLKVGMPVGLSESVGLFANNAFIWIVGGISTNAMLALNIAVAVNYVSIIPIIGIGVGSSVLIANKIGKEDTDGINLTIITSITLAIFYVTLISICELFFPRIFALPFLSTEISEGDLILTDSIIKVLWTYGLPFVFSMIFSSALEAKQKTKIVFWGRTIVMWGISLPTLYWISKTNVGHSFKIVDCWIVGGVYELIIGIIFAFFYFQTPTELCELVEPDSVG